MKPNVDITDPRIAKALAHPLRLQILEILQERDASPSEIAEEIDAPLGNVSYHVRQLASFGLVKLVRETPRRGAVEHHYRAEARPRITDGAWEAMPDIVKQATIASTLDHIGRQVRGAAENGAFDAPDTHLSRSRLLVDDRGRRELAELGVDLLERVQKIEEESTKRLEAANHEGERPSELVLMVFDSPS
ncbi:MAG TPA: winged helix-turn-helix domain-containing protein [Thermoleophilaceae bacterium]